MENTGISNDQKSSNSSGIILDQFLSGNYVLMGYTIGWDTTRGFYQTLNLCKREWFLNSAGKLPKAFPVNVVTNTVIPNNR